MDIKSEIGKCIANAILKCGYQLENVQVNFSNLADSCVDFQFNSVFKLAKSIGENPLIVAQKIVENIEENDEFEFAVSGNGFINIKLTDKKINQIANEMLKSNSLCIEKEEKPQMVVFDYGGANVAKELHVEHLRSPIIGECLKRVNKYMGNKTISDTHLGDWGLQMGLTIAQLEDDGYLDFEFGRGGNKKEITLSLLNDEYPKASKRKDADEEFYNKASAYSLFVQQKKEPYFSIYKDIREISVKKIRENYKKLNAEFDLWWGESTVSDSTKEIVQIFKDKNLVERSEGALVVNVAKDGEHILCENGTYKNPMPPMILEKSNGADLYATTDIATVLKRNKEFSPDRIIYCIDSRQELHFTQFTRACVLAGISPSAQQIQTVFFGTMKGSDGKPFKTRAGGMLRLEDIINLLVEKANEKLTQNGLEKDDVLALKIGVAALKFGDLSNMVTKDYVLDLNAFTSFEGKTGPYLQYTCARIKSLLEKSDLKHYEINITTAEERKVVIEVLKLIDGIIACYQNNTPHTICGGAYLIASAYSTLYNNIKINGEKDLTKKSSLLGISKLSQMAVSTALDLLAIDVPDKM